MRYFSISPYPDEELSSVVTRACRRAGLPPRRFLRWYFDAPDERSLRSYGNLLVPMSRLTGMSQEELLRQHTLVPYALATLERGEARRIRTLMCQGKALQSRYIVGKVARRWCERCATRDTNQFGETYWHRSHLLPGVTRCHVHDQELLDSGDKLHHLRLHKALTFWLGDALPQDLQGGQRMQLPISSRVQQCFAVLSARTLEWHRKLPPTAATFDELHRVFGSDALRHAGCVTRFIDRFPPTTMQLLAIVTASCKSGLLNGDQLELGF